MSDEFEDEEDEILSAIKDRILMCKELPSALRVPLLILISYGTYDPAAGIVYNISPTVPAVASDSGCSVSTVQRAIKAGVELGFIRVTPNYHNGVRSSNNYVIDGSAVFKNLSVHNVQNGA